VAYTRYSIYAVARKNWKKVYVCLMDYRTLCDVD